MHKRNCKLSLGNIFLSVEILLPGTSCLAQINLDSYVNSSQDKFLILLFTIALGEKFPRHPPIVTNGCVCVCLCVGHHYGLMDLNSFGVSRMSLARVDLFKSPNWHILRFWEFLWCHRIFGLSSTFPATNSIICHFFRKPWFLLVGKRPRLL